MSSWPERSGTKTGLHGHWPGTLHLDLLLHRHGWSAVVATKPYHGDLLRSGLYLGVSTPLILKVLDPALIETVDLVCLHDVLRPSLVATIWPIADFGRNYGIILYCESWTSTNLNMLSFPIDVDGFEPPWRFFQKLLPRVALATHFSSE